jgi:ATP-dependent DNA helicase RecG
MRLSTDPIPALPAGLSAAALLDAIRQGEGERLEFKSSFQKEVIETLTAFANTHGGAEQITSPRVIPDISLIQIENKTVAVISIGEYPIKPVACKGRYYKRVGNANHPDPEHTLATISERKVQAFADAVGLKAPFDAVLDKFELIKQGRPTFACHLLFSKNDVFLSTIEAGRFATQTLIKDSITSRDTLVEQVQRMMDFMVKHTNKAYIITGNPKREERWDYPMQALREIIINMIVHRDYRSANDSTINYKSHLRNKQIATIFRELDLIEKYGSGIRRVIDSFVAYGLPEPQFEATQGGMAVTVFKTPTEQTASAQPESQPESRPESEGELKTKVLQLLANSALGKRELSAALGQKAVSGQLNKVVRKLLAADLIEPTVPNQLNSRLQQYRLKRA